MPQALLPKNVEKVMSDTLAVFQKIGKGYKRGVYSKDNCLIMFQNAVAEGFHHFLLYASGVNWMFTDESWKRFLDDLRLWKEGRMPESPVGDPWLFCDEEGSGGELERRMSVYYREDRLRKHTEACPGDKELFFTLMEAYHMPPAQFAPIPEGIVNPERYQVHVYADCEKCVLGFPCADDGGLTGAANPVGKDYVLRSELGLRSEIRILEARPEERRGRFELDIDDFAPPAAYLAEGWIEGYTSGRVRPIAVRTDKDGRIVKLGTLLCPDDEREYLSFPLWQEYFKACEQRCKAETEGYAELFKIYCLNG